MLKIRKLTEKDIPYRVKWLNNPKVNRFVGEVIGKKTTLKKQQEWFSEYRKGKDKVFFMICDDAIPIGFMGFSNISRLNRNADLFVAIGQDSYRGRGFGKLAVRWLMDYGFLKLGLHKINLGVIKDNKQAVNLYKSLGFVVEGEMRDEVFANGRFYDFLSMAIFAKR